MATESRGGSANQPTRLTSAGQASLLVGQVRALLLLDDLWTTHLEALRSGSGDPDFHGLEFVASGIDAGLAGMPDGARWAGGMLARLDDAQLKGELYRIGEQIPSAAPAIERLVHEDLAGLTVQDGFLVAADYVVAANAEERSLLARKRELLSSGEVPDPDISPRYRCGLTLLGLGLVTGASVISGGGLPILMMTVAGEGASFAAGWEGSGCKEAWRAVRERS